MVNAWTTKLQLVAVAAAGLIGVVYLLIYKLNSESSDVEEEDENQELNVKKRKKQKEGADLDTSFNTVTLSPNKPSGDKPTRNCHDLERLIKSLDEDNADVVTVSLRKLSDLAAFHELHRFIVVGLPRILRHLQHATCEAIQIEAANLVNNLALNDNNQTALRRIIPVLLNEMRTNRRHSRQFSLSAARALTNLSLFDDNHQDYLPHLTDLIDSLESSAEDVKLQILKIMVNLSTNEKTTETCLEADARLISSVAPYVIPNENEELLLRAVTCVANILQGLHKRLKNNRHPQVYAPEFVSDMLQSNLERLVSHKNQDIRLHAGRALFALRPPVFSGQSARLNDDDMLEVLKL